jgi:hypothetical protein
MNRGTIPTYGLHSCITLAAYPQIIRNQDSYHFLFAMRLILNATGIFRHRAGGLPTLLGRILVQTRTVRGGGRFTNSSAVQIAKLLETFGRREDVRLLQASGVQWASLAVEALINQIDRIPIDQAVEPLAHLQSLRRIVKVMSKSFMSAAVLYSSTSTKAQEFLQRMEGEDFVPGGPLTEFQPLRSSSSLDLFPSRDLVSGEGDAMTQ